MTPRSNSLIDRFICQADHALRTLANTPNTAGHQARPTPQPAVKAEASLSDQQRKHAAGLMRINHTGEVCAQALYQGQALTAKLPKVRQEMDQAAREELDHLQWCNERLEALGARQSIFNPLWYGLSFGMGATAGLISDSVSLGFVAATEELVCDHLETHLDALPTEDAASRAVVEKMVEEEYQHGASALKAGGTPLPAPVKLGMRMLSKLMTKSTYHISVAMIECYDSILKL